jgi:hypothetical protein
MKNASNSIFGLPLCYFFFRPDDFENYKDYLESMETVDEASESQVSVINKLPNLLFTYEANGT